MRRLLSLLVLLLVGCDGPAPPPVTFRDLDAATPEPPYLVGGGGLGGSVGGGGGGTTMVPDCGARVLVVFDRSGSMNQPWETPDGARPRWEVASEAVTEALEPLASRITAGAILFPTGAEREPGLCAEVAPIASQIPFRAGPAFLDAWTARWSRPEVGGSTPLDPAFARAEEALPFDDEVTAVVVLTDGMPTCTDTPSARERAADWYARGVRTWVVGLPGAVGVGVLDEIAAAGGTSVALSVDAPGVLTEQLSVIVTRAVEQACM